MGVDLATVGQTVGSIEVQLSYKLIELFSGHLYSSPAKAVEELVVNSYDAFATRCVASVPDGLEGAVWVWDNGESMDMQGLRELWLVAETRKRDPNRESAAVRRGRPPIGKFGIGKLASYVLGSRISHICRRNESFLAVTMDYTKISTGKQPRSLSLSVRKLTKSDVETAIPFVADHQYSNHRMDMFSRNAKSWTLVVVDRLKQQLQLGRLRWILTTAMPLVPDFRLFLNGEEIKSIKERIKKLKTWQIGQNDETAKNLGIDTGRSTTEKHPFDYYVKLAPYGNVSGVFELFQDPLDTGKSSDVGYSHGFFIKVRNRLVNMQDNLFGITSLPHGVGFNRLRSVVHADFLDEYLTADREDTAIDAKRALAKYLETKFNEVRNYYVKHVEREIKEETLEEHLKSVPGTLLTYPLRQAVEKISATKRDGYSIRSVQEDKPMVSAIQRIESKESDIGGPLATFERGSAIINENHPFLRSLEDYPGIRKLAVAEILLEAYLLASGVDLEKSAEVLTKRDQLLRVLASKFPEDAIEVSEQIRQSVSSQKDLETSCVDGFRVLGFDAIHLGGKGKPDGLATAHLGVVERRKYVVVIDAKSSQSEEVQSGNLGLATVARHRKEYDADYCVIIAPDYQVSGGEESKAVKEARDQQVCLLRARSFADLVATSAVKPLSLDRIRSLFERCSPEETTDWIEAFKKERPEAPPIKTILETIWKVQTEDQKDAPVIGAIRYKEPSLQKYSSEEMREWLVSLSRLQPDLVVVTGGKVQLNQTPENIIKQSALALKNISKRISGESLVEGLRQMKRTASP